jgi:transcriptional regulator with XRE-family HTH domain
MSHGRAYEKLIRRIAANIKAVRETKGLTQEEMGSKGFSYRHYQRIESGRHSFNLFTLFRLAQAFDVQLKRFFQ